MKKSLVISLAMAFSVAVAGTAFAAANPFDDVPAKHWAYDAVTQLAKDGIVDGYADKTFGGDKTMTRYEMAQVVGKAVSRSAKANAEDKKLIDKLSTEFAAELNNLGVRVSKLEANQSNLKFTGDLRVRWSNVAGQADGQMWKDRFRMHMTSQINDNTSLFARYIFSDNRFNQDSSQRLSDMALTTKFDKHSVTLGRYTLNMGPTLYLAGTTGDVDGIMTNSKFGDFGLMLGYGQARQTIASTIDVVNNKVVVPAGGGTSSTLQTNKLWIKNIAFAEGTYNAGKAKFYADYFKNLNAGASDGNDHTVADAYKILGGGVAYNFDGNVTLIGEYYKNNANDVKLPNGDAPTATIVRVKYKGVNAAKPGSWGMYFEHAKFTGNTLPYKFTGPQLTVNPNDWGLDSKKEGVEYYATQVDCALAKNIVFNAIYQFNPKSTATGKDAPYSSFSRAQINYYF